MYRRFQLYFQRLGLFNGLITLLILSQVLLAYSRMWQAGLWWLCVALFVTGAGAACIYRLFMYRNIERAGSVVSLCTYFVLGMYGLQALAHVRIPLPVIFFTHVVMWFTWVAGFFLLSYDPWTDHPGLRSAVEELQDDRNPIPVDPDEENPYRRVVDR